MLTAEAVIARADEYKPNDCAASEKLEVVYALDRRIMSEIIDTHEGGEAYRLYDRSDPARPVLVDGREDMYLYRLLAAIDLRNGDLVRYNNDSALFNAEYESFRNEYNRSHTPKGVKLRY